MQRLGKDIVIADSALCMQGNRLQTLVRMPHGEWRIGVPPGGRTIACLEDIFDEHGAERKQEIWAQQQAYLSNAKLREEQAKAVAAQDSNLADRISLALSRMTPEAQVRLVQAFEAAVVPQVDSLTQGDVTNSHADGYGQGETPALEEIPANVRGSGGIVRSNPETGLPEWKPSNAFKDAISTEEEDGAPIGPAEKEIKHLSAMRPRSARHR